MYKVSKSFHTANRRFGADADVGPDDIQGAVPFDVWVQRGFIAAEQVKVTPVKATKAAAQE